MAKDKVEIENGIPVPALLKNNAKKYPWNEMNIGDSFLIPQKNGEDIQYVRSRAYQSVHKASRFGRKYCTRTVEGGVRVWRIS